MLTAAVVVGSAIDLSRAYKVENRLQAACDAAVLAGRRTITTHGFDTASENAAKAYFGTNFDDGRQETHGTSFVVAADEEANTVTATASTVLDTLIMRLFGFDDFTLRTHCTSSMGVGNADVMMVLDTTGSMDSTLSGSQTRIMALRSAMKNFYTTLKTATTGTNARIRYGFVPYSSSVNVGQLLYDLDPNYLVDQRTYQSRQATFIEISGASTSTGGPNYQNSATTGWSYYDGTRYFNASSCNSAKPANETVYTDYGSPTNSTSNSTNNSGQTVVTATVTQGQRKATYDCYQQNNNKYYVIVQYATRDKVTSTTYTGASFTTTPSATTIFDHWTYKPVTYDTSMFKTFSPVDTYTGANGTALASTWDGCIEERQTVANSTFSYSSVTGITPSGALDLDIDSAPTSSDATKWAPLWHQVAYYRTSGNKYTTAASSTGDVASYACPAAARSLAEMDETSFSNYADSLVANGNTYLDIGMIWGGRMLSPDGIFQDTVNDAPSNGGEVSRHIIFMTDGEMAPYNYAHTAWGMEYWDRRVTSDGSSGDTSRHTARFLAVCQAIKDKGIRVWVIAFTSGLSSDLTKCASDNSSFTATDGAALDTAFQEIAKQVGELRITG
jgi:hypothetical protein